MPPPSDRILTQKPDALTPKQARSLLMALPVALIVGISLAAGGAYFAFAQINLSLRGEIVWGEVVRLEPGSSTNSSGQAALFPMVSFRAGNGGLVTIRHRTGRNPPFYSVGEKVPVIYLPGRPDEALIMEGGMNWALPGVLLLAGSLLIVLSLRGIAAVRRELARAGPGNQPP
jgi:hypothetical protein